VIVSVLTAHPQALTHVKDQLAEEMGPVEEEVGPLGFAFTSYYERELGAGIRRWIWSFSELVDRSELAAIKCFTNDVERAHLNQGRRRLNLDPGLLTLGNFVLATGKDRAHRVYLRSGIFADLTLVYRGGRYRPLDWTYPDYAGKEITDILARLRETYKCKLKSKGLLSFP
jgi:hypothetical protein